jgi:hypothetical protein
MSDRVRIENLTKKVLQDFYTAQYKAALLGLIQFIGKTPDELIDEVHTWLRYEVDNLNKPIDRRLF